MMNEIDCLKDLDHPNILRMYESYECEKRYYIVTDISRGGELFDEIDDDGSGYLDREEVRTVPASVQLSVDVHD